MSLYLSHLAALTLNQVEPVQPRLASRFETPVEKGHSVNNGLDLTQESRISAPPVHVQSAPVSVTESPGPMKLMPKRAVSPSEMPVDRGPSGNNGLKVTVESQVAPSAHAQPLRNPVTDRADRVKPVQAPQLASQFETTDNSEPADKNDLDIALESRVAAPPTSLQASKNNAPDSPDRVKPMQPRLTNRFEMRVDRGPSGLNGWDIAQESTVVPPAYVQPSQVTAANSSDRVKLRLTSRFDIPVGRGPSGNTGMDAAQESGVVQPSHETATDSSVAQGIAKKSVDGQAKKMSGGQDQPKVVVEPTGIRIKKSEPPGDTQKPTSGQGFAAFNTMADAEQANRSSQSINKPVARSPYEVRKDTLPTENVRTLVERVQERLTETTHSELVIREVAAPDANKKTTKPEQPPRAAPVKPASIVVRPEQYTAPNTARQAGIQSIQSQSPAHSGTDSTPAQTIQVTIGRIEIRATQVADKPIARPRAASKTMSLDDYLKQRESKERT